MNRVKIYICSAVFVLLTALKLLLPGQAVSLRQEVRGILERDDDYSRLVTVLGERLAEDRSVTGLIQAFRRDVVGDPQPAEQESGEETETETEDTGGEP